MPDEPCETPTLWAVMSGEGVAYCASSMRNGVKRWCDLNSTKKMTTKYIVLTKDERDAIDNNTNNQIFFVNKPLVYLMPSVNHTYYAERGLFENNLIEWCKQFCNQDSLFLDIGAHTGSYAISLAPYAQRVIAFEPQKMTFYALCGGVALSAATNIECMKIGLGNSDQVGVKTLHIVSNDSGGSTVHAPAGDKLLGSENIEIRTLDFLEYPRTHIFHQDGCRGK